MFIVLGWYGIMDTFVVSRKAEEQKPETRKWGVGGFMVSAFVAISDHLLRNFFLDQIILLQKGGHTKSALAES